MRILHAAVTGLVGVAVLGAQAQAPKPERDWPSPGHDAGAMRYSPLTQIHTGNVSTLQTAWTYDTPAPVSIAPAPVLQPAEVAADAAAAGPPAAPEDPLRPRPRQSASTPLVIDGVMYLATMYNRIVALDADTGKEIWVKDIGQTPATRGLAYWPGTRDIPARLVFGTGDRIVAADRARCEDGRVRVRVRPGRQGRSAPGCWREVSETSSGAVLAPGHLPESHHHRQSLAGGPQPGTDG